MGNKRNITETESTPTLCLVNDDDCDWCLICSERIDDKPHSTTSSAESEPMSICYEVLGLGQSQQEFIESGFDKTEVQFCLLCINRLNLFKDIQRQLTSLTHQLTQIQRTVINAIGEQEKLTDKSNQHSSSVIRSRIGTVIRIKSEPILILQDETITGDLNPAEYDKIEFEDADSENKNDADWFPSSPVPSEDINSKKLLKMKERKLQKKRRRKPKFHSRQATAVEIESIIAKPCEVKLQRLDQSRSKNEDGKWDAASFCIKNKRKRTKIWKKKSKNRKPIKEEEGPKLRGRPRGKLPDLCRWDPTRDKKERYVCGHCGKGERSCHHLDIHVRVRHTDGFLSLCEYCSKPFKSKTFMVAHQRKMHRDQLLSTRTDTEVQLEKIKSLTCEPCNMTFTLQTAKKNHDRRVHSGETLKFVCETCGSRWVSIGILHHHMKIHQGKKFQCSGCDMKFNRAGALDRHFQNKHLGIRNFPCEKCPKAFLDKNALIRHTKLIHEDRSEKKENQFSCNVCSYTCPVRDYLVIHSKSKRHLQKIQELGFTDINSGLNFNGTKPRKPRFKQSSEAVADNI